MHTWIHASILRHVYIHILYFVQVHAPTYLDSSMHIYIYISGQIIATSHDLMSKGTGNPLISGKSRLVKYYNLARYILYVFGIWLSFFLFWLAVDTVGRLQVVCVPGL